MTSECSACASVSATGTGREKSVFQRIVWIALVSNTVMFVVELIASFVSGSVSLHCEFR
jgi:divalent metal cation (Fe/Co/Zn/Cd) transporter